MTKAILHILDEVNVKIDGLSVECRRALVKSLEFYVPGAKFLPAVRLGRWDGKMSFCTMGGSSYINLLDTLLPIVQQHGYEIEIEDHRAPAENFEFELVKEDSYSHIMWPKGHPIAGQPVMIKAHQAEVINLYLQNLSGISVAPTGSGKAQPLYSKIKTPNGWTTMGEIKAGDLVSTPDGKNANVIGIYPQGNKDIYEITFSDGRKARSCNDHLWNVYNKSWTHKWKTIDLNEIIRLKKETKGDYYIPLLTYDSAPDAVLPLDPYMLGLLLGDGSFRHNRIGFTTADDNSVEYIMSVLDEDYVLSHKSNYDYSLKFKTSNLGKKAHSDNLKSKLRNSKGHFIPDMWRSANKYINIISELGLINKKSQDKFIPEIYKFGSVKQREDILAGLVDSDGYVDNGSISISTSSKIMAEDIQSIVRSIGGSAVIRSKIPTYTYKGQKMIGLINYNVSIRYPNMRNLTKLPRKLAKLPEVYQYKDLKLKIESIEYIGSEKSQCIMIDHEDHLYITDDFVVTHNTLITAILSHKVQTYGRSIVIVPTKDLVTQTEEDYINMGLDVGVYFGDRKDYGKTHTICTWQSLDILCKKSKEQDLDVDIGAFFENIVCVIVDECHKSKADALRRMLSGPLANAPIRWGLTGTMPEEQSDKIGVIACIGPLLGKINTKELQDLGILANLHVNVWQLQDLGEAAFTNYQAELKWLTTSQARLKFLAKSVIEMADSGNTLILVDRVQTGEMLQALIPDSIFISGKMKSKDRKEEYKEVQEVDGKVIIATYGVASTGINIVRIYNLVLFEAGKSFVRVIQSIGRGIRVAPDKKFVNVYDVCSNCKFSKRHLTKRKAFYKEAEYEFTINKISY